VKNENTRKYFARCAVQTGYKNNNITEFDSLGAGLVYYKHYYDLTD